MNGTFNNMNTFPNFTNTNTNVNQVNCPQNVVVNRPIVTREVNVVNRYCIIEQPHIHEVETQYVNHFITRHQYIKRPICNETNVYSEENDCGCN